jgi:hypothetical protein
MTTVRNGPSRLLLFSPVSAHGGPNDGVIARLPLRFERRLGGASDLVYPFTGMCLYFHIYEIGHGMQAADKAHQKFSWMQVAASVQSIPLAQQDLFTQIWK